MIGRETIKIMKNKEQIENVYPCSTVKNTKINFIDIDNISSDNDLISYNGEIKYIYFKPITDEMKINLPKSNNKKELSSFITMDEFEECLSVLYKNNYIMVDIFDIYKQIYREGKFKVQRQDLKIPKGKKPFVLFVDDFSYGKSKLVIDDNDLSIKLMSCSDEENLLSYNQNVITVVDKFIKENDGFCFNKARPIVSIVGSESIFGYHTGKMVKGNHGTTQKIKKLSSDIYDAKKIADKLKKDGWRFACNTYSNINFKNVTNDVISMDINNWFRYVSNIIGYTNLFVYPQGDFIDKNDDRFKYLNSNGFNIFCSSMNKVNKDSFKVEDYIYINHDLISYYTVNNNNCYNIFKEVIKTPIKGKKIKNM